MQLENFESHIGRAHPVARIGSIRIPPVAIIGDCWIGDEIVAREQAWTASGTEIWMIKADPGIQIRNDNVAAPRRGIPRRKRVDR